MSIERCKKSWNCKLKENLSELVEGLNNLCNQLHTLYHINCGGCCYTAYCIAKMLEQVDLRFSLVVFDNEYEVHSINHLQDLPESMQHYAIVLNDQEKTRCLNCELSDFRIHHQIYQTNSLEILDYYLNNAWNDEYDRNNNPIVQTLIEKFCYEFFNSLY